jgi:hypothetical protein
MYVCKKSYVTSGCLEKKLLETRECCQNSNETWGWVKSSIDNMENRQNGNKALGLVQCSIGTIECHQKLHKFWIGTKKRQ